MSVARNTSSLLPSIIRCSRWQWISTRRELSTQWPSIHQLPRSSRQEPHQIDMVPRKERLSRFKNIVMPPAVPTGDNELPPMPAEPALFPDENPRSRRKEAKRTYDTRGPEIIHSELIHNQYAIVAEAPGFLDPRHFSTLRTKINAHINAERFAVWRVEPPWLARTQISRGKKKGGGKGKIKTYETPIRIGRIIVEVGGKLTEIEAQSFLVDAARSLPFVARFVTYEELKAEERELERIRRENLNPFNWDMFVKYNMQNCRSWMSDYEIAHKGRGY